MTEHIIKELSQLGINSWIINVYETDSNELFLIKKREDMIRRAEYSETSVTVFRDFERNGEKKRGSSQVKFNPSASSDEIRQKLSQAYENAANAANPYFELPEPTRENKKIEEREPLIQILRKMQAALTENDNSEESFLNSAEIFVSTEKHRTLTSRGGDVSYEMLKVKGEFVVQCKQPQDVEMYFSFDYFKADTEALSALVQKALRLVKDRASACVAPESGTYDIILTDEQISELMCIYLEKCDAGMVYPGYSQYKAGTQLHAENIKGEKLTIDVFSRAPFSNEGIPMPERPLIKDGEVCGIYGAARFCRYLGLEPTGPYSGVIVHNGTVPFEKMKSGRVLLPVSFSDFQCEAFGGTFGGEIRLAYLYEDGKVTVLTGGSINGRISKIQDKLIFSTERYESAWYRGPKAVLISGVSVAGQNSGQ